MVLGLSPVPSPDPVPPEEDPDRLGKAAKPASPPPMMTRITTTKIATPRLCCRNGKRLVILDQSPGRLEAAAVAIALSLAAERAMTG